MSEHDELVEKVARAIASELSAGRYFHALYNAREEDAAAALKQAARAALSAMPTAGDGWRATRCFECNTELHGPSCPACDATALDALVAERDALRAEIERLDVVEHFARAAERWSHPERRAPHTAVTAEELLAAIWHHPARTALAQGGEI